MIAKRNGDGATVQCDQLARRRYADLTKRPQREARQIANRGSVARGSMLRGAAVSWPYCPTAALLNWRIPDAIISGSSPLASP